MRPGGVTGIVLAGGRSTRFGGDKLAVEVDERPLLHRAIAGVAEVVAEVVVVLGAEAAEPALPADAPVPIRVARDALPGRGPLAGLAAGLAAAGHPLAILVGGDQPSLRADVLRLLVEEMGPGRGEPVAGEPVGGEPVAGEPVAGEPTAGASAAGDRGPDVAILADGDRIWPFPVAVRVATVRPAAEAALLGPDLRLFMLYRRLRVACVAEARWRALDPEGASLRDVDTPRDLPST